jgi:hypothetical protein
MKIGSEAKRGEKVKKKGKSYPCNRPLRPIGL